MSRDHDTPDAVDGDCIEAFDHLYAFLQGELTDPAAIAMMEHHLDHCRSCYSRAQLEREIDARLQAESEGAPDTLRVRLDKLIDSF